MSALSILAVRNRALAEHRPMPDKLPAVAPPYAFLHPFDDTHWRVHQLLREAQDRLSPSQRFHVAIDPGDGCIRDFYLVGTLAEVEHRSHLLFKNSRVVAIAPAADGVESIDRRLSVLPPIALGS